MKTTKSGKAAERPAVNEAEQDNPARLAEFKIDAHRTNFEKVKRNKSGKAAERPAVNKLIDTLRKKKKSDVYIFVDRDSGSERHTSSGWDFLIVRGPYCVFVEAKVGAGRLTEYQEFTRAEVKAAGGRYVVLRFSDDGRRYTVDGGAPRAVADVTLNDFFRGWK